MFTFAKILLMLLLASFLVANSQGIQDSEGRTFKSTEVSSSNSSSASSSEISSGSTSAISSGSLSETSSEFSTLTSNEIDIDSSEISEPPTQLDIYSGTEENKVAKPHEILSGNASSKMYSPSLSSETFALLTETPVVLVTEGSPEAFAEIDIPSATEDFFMPQSKKILSGDKSSEIDIVPSNSEVPTTIQSVLFLDASMDELIAPDHKGTTEFPRLNEISVGISNEDATETSSEVDVPSGREDFFMPQSKKILSGDKGSEIDIVPSNSEVPTKESVLFSGDSRDEITVRFDEPTEVSTEDIFPEREEVNVPTSNKVSSDNRISEIDILVSSATTTTKSVLFPDVPRSEIIASPDPKGTKESVKPKRSSDIITTPASSQNSPTVMSMDLPISEEQGSDASNTSQLRSNTERQEKKTSVGILVGSVLGSVVGAALLATVAFLLYRTKKNNLFAHQRFFDEKNEPVQILDNTSEPYNLTFGGTSFFNSAVLDAPVMEKNMERAGENIQMKTVSTACTLNKPWGIGLQDRESYSMPRTVSNPKMSRR